MIIESLTMPAISLTDIKTIAESFQAFCIGIGALVAGFAAYAGLADWREKQAAIQLIKKTREKYPSELIGKEILIGYPNNAKGTWYLIDKRDKTSHHIQNIGTLGH